MRAKDMARIIKFPFVASFFTPSASFPNPGHTLPPFLAAYDFLSCGNRQSTSTPLNTIAYKKFARCRLALRLVVSALFSRGAEEMQAKGRRKPMAEPRGMARMRRVVTLDR